MKFTVSLKKNEDFKAVYREKRSRADRFLVLYVRKNDLDINRIGISVSKKVGNSVVRHHVTRLIRESYRLHEDMLNSGFDMVVVARREAKDASFKDIEASLLFVASLQKIIKK